MGDGRVAGWDLYEVREIEERSSCTEDGKWMEGGWRGKKDRIEVLVVRSTEYLTFLTCILGVLGNWGVIELTAGMSVLCLDLVSFCAEGFVSLILDIEKVCWNFPCYL